MTAMKNTATNTLDMMNKSLKLLGFSLLLGLGLQAPTWGQAQTPNGNDPNAPNFLNSPFNQQNFVPNISLILDMSLSGRDITGDAFRMLESPFHRQHRGSLGHTPNLNNGFNLNYAELTMQAPVDPYVELFSTFHLSAFEFEIEEAYAVSRGLPFNLQLKGGKFLSHFGRINMQHAHFWSFGETPLVYKAFLGDEGLNEIGAQVSWVAPTDIYLNLGFEALQGTNFESFGTSGFAVGSSELKPVNWPNAFVGFVKTSFDIEDTVILAGVSYAQGGSRAANAFGDSAASDDGHLHVHQVSDTPLPPALDYFAGSARILGADLTLRHFINSYQDITWQSEYLHRWMGGSHYDTDGRRAVLSQQNGAYSQLLWRFQQQWRTGARVDLLGMNTQNETSYASFLPRYSAMVEYYPSEFSRFRLQYTHDRSQYLNQAAAPFHEVSFQVNLAMGAHGAHEF